MEEASKRYLSEIDRNLGRSHRFDFKSTAPAEKLSALLKRFNNSLLDLLTAAAEKENVDLRLECLELEGSWNLQWIEERKNMQYVPLIPETVTPSFFGCAISILNNRGKKDIVNKYLEIFSEPPYCCFHASKALTFERLRLLENREENSEETEAALFKEASTHAQFAADQHYTPGYFLLAYVYYFTANIKGVDSLIHYEFAYKMMLIGVALKPHCEKETQKAMQSAQHLEAESPELTAITKMTQFLSNFFSDPQYEFQRERAKTAADKEAREIIAQCFPNSTPEDPREMLRLC